MDHQLSRRGIVGTASLGLVAAASGPDPGLYDDAQAKAATMSDVKSLAKHLASKGIRGNGVAPEPIWTPLQASGGATIDKLDRFGDTTPMGWAGQPAELGSIYVQPAATDES